MALAADLMVMTWPPCWLAERVVALVAGGVGGLVARAEAINDPEIANTKEK